MPVVDVVKDLTRARTGLLDSRPRIDHWEWGSCYWDRGEEHEAESEPVVEQGWMTVAEER